MEWEECRVKAGFLAARREEFRLIETLRLEVPGGYLWLLDHLRRLRRSARYFGFTTDLGRAIRALREAKENTGPGSYRIRLLFSRDASADWERSSPAGSWPSEGVRVGLSPERVDSSQVWLHHKTTRREWFDRATRDLRGSGLDEILFLNEEGFVTEASYTSVMVRSGGEWVCPSEDCGLLPGVWRERFRRSFPTRSHHLTLEDLKEAEWVLIGNSVRGSAFVREMILPEGEVCRWTPPKPVDGAERMRGDMLLPAGCEREAAQ
jgi:para-aminobenzoate synthetase/4-amino-4-deoxychorismate lyase